MCDYCARCHRLCLMLLSVCGAQLTRIFDLKGSMRNRYINKKGGDGKRVLLDLNLLECESTVPAPGIFSRSIRVVLLLCTDFLFDARGG